MEWLSRQSPAALSRPAPLCPVHGSQPPQVLASSQAQAAPSKPVRISKTSTAVPFYEYTPQHPNVTHSVSPEAPMRTMTPGLAALVSKFEALHGVNAPSLYLESASTRLRAPDPSKRRGPCSLPSAAKPLNLRHDGWSFSARRTEQEHAREDKFAPFSTGNGLGSPAICYTWPRPLRKGSTSDFCADGPVKAKN